MVSLGDLVASARGAIIPIGPYDAAIPVTGVHVSELADPGRYLAGGELLLTTGMPLNGTDDTAYIARLADSGLRAVGLGLGEGWDAPPDGFVSRCADRGIAVLVVPDGQPFLAVSRAFWALEHRDERSAGARAAHAHTRLVEAAGAADPTPELVRLLAQSTGGWAAWIPLDSRFPDGYLHPTSLDGLLPTIDADVRRSLARSGAGAASFLSHGSAVVAYPVRVAEATIGALVLGATRPLAPPDRQLVRTAAALVPLLPTLGHAPIGSAEEWIVRLALDGDAQAARSLARSAGIALPSAVRVLVTSAATSPPGPAVSAERNGLRYTLWDADADADADADTDTDVPVARGALSAPVGLEDVPAAAGRARALWTALDTDRLAVEPGRSRADRWVDELDAIGMRETVRAHLRGGQRVDRTAQTMGLHRNTVRLRLASAERQVGIDITDADVAAELWLALRARENGAVSPSASA